jgi:phage tail tape-measure protein
MTEGTSARPGRTSPPAEPLAGAMLAGHDKALGMAADRMLKAAPKTTRYVLKRVPGLPGLVYDAATLATANDKRRELVGMAGGALGAVAGGALGAATGPAAPVAAPLGAAAGSAAGEQLAEALYDNRLNIKAWMAIRAATLGHQVAAELRRYAPYDLPSRALRR